MFFSEPRDPSLMVEPSRKLKIASEFRFTVEEVQEYYDKHGDIAKTHSRFQRMREMIAQLDDD